MYRKLSAGRMLLVLGDATGHGIHSAMIAATARGAVEALAGVDERLLTPEQVLRAIDHAIRMVGEHNVLMTAFAAVFDSTTGALHYANAGQNFPYVIKLRRDRACSSEASIIAASGNPLGDRNIAGRDPARLAADAAAAICSCASPTVSSSVRTQRASCSAIAACAAR